MLARTRTDPKTLHPKCTETHLDILARVAHEFRTGGVMKTNLDKKGGMLLIQPSGKLFNIHAWDTPYEAIKPHRCGTAHCIGGWGNHYLRECSSDLMSFDDLATGSDNLQELFYPLCGETTETPECRSVFWDAITTVQAAQAIENVLYHGGWPKWREVCAL